MGETEAWGIGKVSDKCIRVTEDGDTDHMRIGSPGDILLEVEKFEPVAAGSSTFEWASKTELINAESLRFVPGTHHRARSEKVPLRRSDRMRTHSKRSSCIPTGISSTPYPTSRP